MAERAARKGETMKRFLNLIVLPFVAGTLHAQAPAPAVVQHAGLDCGMTAKTCAVSFAATSSPGNRIVAFVREGGASPQASVTDDGGNIYVIGVACPQPSDPHISWIFYSQGTTLPAKTLTVTGALNTSARMDVAELSNAGIMDSSSCGKGSGTAASTGPIAESIANEIVVAEVSTANVATVTAGPGFALLDSAGKVFSEFQIPAPAGSVNAGFALTSGTGWWSAAGISFLPGIPPPPPDAVASFACTPSFPGVAISSFVSANAAARIVSIQNSGANPLTIQSITVPTGFSLDANPSLPVSIAPGDTQTFTVRFTPAAAGTYIGNVNFFANVKDGSFQMGVQATAN
jgi:hypothetical protein